MRMWTHERKSPPAPRYIKFVKNCMIHNMKKDNNTRAQRAGLGTATSSRWSPMHGGVPLEQHEEALNGWNSSSECLCRDFERHTAVHQRPVRRRGSPKPGFEDRTSKREESERFQSIQSTAATNSPVSSPPDVTHSFMYSKRPSRKRPSGTPRDDDNGDGGGGDDNELTHPGSSVNESVRPASSSPW